MLNQHTLTDAELEKRIQHILWRIASYSDQALSALGNKDLNAYDMYKIRITELEKEHDILLNTRQAKKKAGFKVVVGVKTPFHSLRNIWKRSLAKIVNF